jgi:transaldolase
MTQTQARTRTRLKALLEQGQSVWLDYLRRSHTRSGELADLIADGLRGQTSNPTIFEHALKAGAEYDDDLRAAVRSDRSDAAIFESLAVADVREAADRFRPGYDATDGADGFVSIEVSPGLARDTAGTVSEARRLWKEVSRPNVMIKIPGTREGWPAIERCLTEGININITLLFSVDHYQAVAAAYLNALEARITAGEPVRRLASVASFFVSRVDTEVDRRLAARSGRFPDLAGHIAVANAQLAYGAFLDISRSARWRALAAQGARVQRPLWASTGTKNPAYSDVLYVDSLIGPDTVTTLPPDTLEHFEDHGTVARALTDDALAAGRRRMDALTAAGIDFADVNRVLEDEGIEKFAASYRAVLGVIAERRQALA